MEPALSLLFGAIVGLSLGLTGGGGSIFAVPLLVFGLGVEAHDAVGISLAAVGATAGVGAVQRLRRGEVEVKIGLVFAGMGMLGAPLGTWLNGFVLAEWLLFAFALLMVFVALRMWRRATRRPDQASAVRAVAADAAPDDPAPAGRRDTAERLRMTSRRIAVLAALGFGTGVFSGLFGVGGGFVIVPALVLAVGMGIHSAVATSLLVIALVSLSGTASYVIAGRGLDLGTTGLFAAGGVVGMTAGSALSRRLSGPALQKGFAIAMLVIGAFVAWRSLS